MKCIVNSTDILEEVDACCSRIIIIDRGKVVRDTTPDDLRREEGGELDAIFRKLTTRDTAPAGKGGDA